MDSARSNRVLAKSPVEVVMDESAKVVPAETGDMLQIALNPLLDDFFDELTNHKPVTYTIPLTGSKRFDVQLVAQIVPRQSA